MSKSQSKLEHKFQQFFTSTTSATLSTTPQPLPGNITYLPDLSNMSLLSVLSVCKCGLSGFYDPFRVNVLLQLNFEHQVSINSDMSDKSSKYVIRLRL